ncbi:unnamed protein product [Orchesella dallaii]|uniref:Uncharacterized protein n=1 Tax=Orchesella dallaii TaxID=48710 RepID=A0ABP1S384_9HEXA
MCCTSLRGAAYFGASIHITLGAVLFIRYVIVTAFLTFFNVTDVIKDRITGYLLPFVAYITLFLAFGIVIFHSVEKEYFIILKWATLGFSILQLVVLVALYTLRFLPAYEYRQFPFLPVSITDGYVNSGFQTTDTAGPSGGPVAPDHLPEDYSEFLPKLTRSPSGGVVYPTSATVGSGSSTSSRGSSVYGNTGSSAEISPGMIGSESSSGSDLNFIHPVPTTPPNKWLAEVYSLIALIIMTVVSLVYLVLLFIYVRQLIYEDSGHVYGHAQSVTRNVAFYVQPQFAQSGNSDNKLTNSPSPALRSKALHNMQGQQAMSNCTQPVSNTQIPSEFLPQPHNQMPHHHQQQQQQQRTTVALSQQPRHHIGNHLKPGNSVDPNASHQKDLSHPQQQQQQSSSSAQQQSQTSQNPNTLQRSPVPPAKAVQQNIQSQQQQQVITIYPQKGGGYTSSSSSPRMQVKFAKPLEQHPNMAGGITQSHSLSGSGDPMGSQEPTRSCLVNPGHMQPGTQPVPPQPPPHMVPPPIPQRLESCRNLPPASQPPPYQQGSGMSPSSQNQFQQGCNMPPPQGPSPNQFQQGCGGSSGSQQDGQFQQRPSGSQQAQFQPGPSGSHQAQFQQGCGGPSGPQQGQFQQGPSGSQQPQFQQGCSVPSGPQQGQFQQGCGGPSGSQQGQFQQGCGMPPPLPPPYQAQPPSHIQGQQGPPYAHHQQPPPPQHMPYHGKGRVQQQSYNDMVDNSSYLVFSGNPNTSKLASAPQHQHHPSHMASASHTYPHCSQRRPSGSGSMV